MGLTGLVLDTVVISCAAAGLRRTTGVNVHNGVSRFVSNPSAKMAVSAYFNMGEYIVDKGVQIATKKSSNEKDRSSDS